MTMPVPHPYSTTVRVRGGHGARNRRPPSTPQLDYWRQTATSLQAGATATVVTTPPGAGFSEAVLIPAVASAGPQGAGEQWLVDLIHLYLPGLNGLPVSLQPGIGPDFPPPPLVVQQIASQQAGIVTTQPPPVVAQVWRCYAGVVWNAGKLLAQTTQGANDALSVSCPLISQGEVITVVWYGWASVTTGLPHMSLSGTRYALSTV
jgi:hypothetical protein